MNRMKHALLVALVLLAAPTLAFGQAPGCEGEWAVDGMGLRIRDEDGNWRYWTPPLGSRPSRSVTFVYPDGDTEKRIVVGGRRDDVETVFGVARTEWLIRHCGGPLNAALARTYGTPDFLFFERDRPLPPIGVIPLWRDQARPAGEDEFLLAIPGSDLVVRKDDLFVLVGDRLPGEAVHVLALSPDQRSEVTGPASDIVADLAERGATDLDDIEVRGDDTGALVLELRARGSDGGWRDVSYRIEPSTAAEVAEAEAAPVPDEAADPLEIATGVWAVARIVGLERSTETPEDLFQPPPLPAGHEWWSVRAEVVNGSGETVWVEAPNAGIHLVHEGRGERYRFVDLLWEGSRQADVQITNGSVTTRLAFAPGETGILIPVFQVPTDADPKDVQLWFLDAPRVPLAR